ncbi:DUF6383 domain-containing protein [Parabacteroides timonensis]|uniref:DUF6383 domain-containing protein n=1 Tax=Parabacteroides timonensis TaxID=1871013 RepID=UPI00094E7210|nr:DUF6383 domain-containing protein [Parabacteroides timonensis]
MNKKFSTLVASVLLAGGFSFSAQAAGMPTEAKAGDYVKLGTEGTSALAIGNNGVLSKVDLNSIIQNNAFQEGKTFKDLFNTLWRVEVIKPAETSAALSYRFVNKQTGEYLAIKLQTNNKGASTAVAKIDATGNKEWSVDANGHLYAYVPNATAGKDSTFYLDANLKLAAKQGLPGTLTGTAFTITLPNDYITLTAKAFNDVMALPGNGGKLYFNNGKDVSSNETNVLTAAKKWEAVEYTSAANTFALWNGETVKGFTNDMTKTKDGKGYIQIDKKKYLQVDTIYQDDANKYFALVADTVPNDKYAAGKVGEVDYIAGAFTGTVNSAKGSNIKRASVSAEFSGVYYYGNDSLVLNTTVVPKPLNVSGTEMVSVLTDIDGYTDLYTAAIMATAANKDLKDAVNALNTAYESFIAASNSTNAEVEFKTDNAALIDAVKDLNTPTVAAITSYVDAFSDLKQSAQTVTPGTVSAIAGYDAAKTKAQGNGADTEIANLDAAYQAFLTKAAENNTDAAITFAAAKFDANGTWNTGGTSTGQTLITAVDDAATHTDVQAYTVLFADFECPAQTKVDGQATPIVGYDELKDAVLAVAAENTTLRGALNALDAAYNKFINLGGVYGSDYTFTTVDENSALIEAVKTNNTANAAAVTDYAVAFDAVKYAEAIEQPVSVAGKYFTNGTTALTTESANNGQVVLRKLGKGMVLTVVNDGALDPTKKEDDGTINGYTLPLMQPYATMAGDAVIATNNLYFWQIKNEVDPKNTDKFNVASYSDEDGSMAIVASADTSTYNPATQWAIVKGATDGYYQIVNRETAAVEYVGPVFVVKDEDGKAIADTYTNGTDTLKLIAVDRSGLKFETEDKVAYDYNGYFYAGEDNSLINRTFKISSASPYLNALYMQSKKDSVVVLGEDAVVWYLETVKDSKLPYGLEVVGFEDMKRAKYHVYMTDADGNKYYIYNNSNDNVFSITRSDSKEAESKAAFYFKAVAEGQYMMIDTKTAATWAKMTVNPQPKQPIVESSSLISEKNDYFTIEQTNLNVYRELGVTKADDGLMLNGVDSAKIFMENEPTRFLYENSVNIVANNGNEVAKDSLNFLGIYNAAATQSEAALFIDTAYVDREDNYMPQYMIGLRQSYQEAGTIIDCPDKNPNCTDPSHRKATDAYRTADYLVSLSDSVPAGVKTHPSLYDGAYRLAFVPATHIADTIIISSSKFVGTKQHKNDSLIVKNNTPNKATFALRIKDQDTKSFYMETVGGAFVRILNGVPVLTDKIADAAIFNISKTTEAPVANENINASSVSVIAGEGYVTIKGAQGKTVAISNILGQTIANTVLSSDNAEIAAPQGVVVVAVEGEAAVKAIVK